MANGRIQVRLVNNMMRGKAAGLYIIFHNYLLTFQIYDVDEYVAAATGE